MNKLSEYIPLIIILVSVLFSIIGRKKNQSRVTRETMLPGRTVEELVEERKSFQPVIDSYQRISEKKPQKQTIKKQEIISEKETGHISPTPMIIEPEEDEPSFQFEEDDIVQAIIYTEIINRKEY